MDVRAIDHVNLRIPADGVDEALGFYRDVLGFEPENLDRYERGERPLFSVRLNESAVVHLRPDEAFTPPAGESYDHVAVVVEASIDEVKRTLAEAGVDVERESTPLGATGSAPAVYVRDPFGYLLELKTVSDRS